MRFWEAFDHVFVINLQERADRRKRMERELKRVGCPTDPSYFTFFNAIRKAECNGFPNAGLHGCFMSHMQVYKQSLEKESRSILVLEDDIVFRPDFFRRSERIVTKMEGCTDWELIYFGHNQACSKYDDGLFLATGEIIGSHTYAVRKPGIERLFEWFCSSLELPPGHADGGRISPDGVLNHYKKNGNSKVVIKFVQFSRNNLILYQTFQAPRVELSSLCWIPGSYQVSKP